MRILLLDIETSPNTAYVWGLWNETIPLQRLIESSETLCWTAKWLGDKEVFFSSKQKDLYMVQNVWSMLDVADVIVHYNGTKFDIPTLNKEFVKLGMPPPSPYKQVDLYKVVKKNFRFPSNKLEYVCKTLGLGSKEPTTFELWVDCMNNVDEAWKKMESYNKQDVMLLEKLFERLRAWFRFPLNFSIVDAGALVCPNCGSNHYQRRGFSYTNTCVYQRYRCNGCHSWFRSTKNEGPTAGNKFTII